MPPKLKDDPSIWRLAADLDLKPGPDPVTAILRACQKKTRSFLREFPCTTLTELLDTAAAKLDTLFIEIHTNEELLQIKRDFTLRGEISFANLEDQLSANVYAITFRLLAPRPLDRKFVSLIDCRGAKRFRSYFSKWHELAHLLTLTPQMRLKFCRTHVVPEKKDPEEALMDVIAGEVGFLPAIVGKHAIGHLTFRKIEELREQLCAEASQQAAVIGFVKAWPRPCVLVQARLASRKREEALASQPGFDFRCRPAPALRAVHAMANEAARARGVLIPQNMRVPERSIIYQAFSTGAISLQATEDLSWWESSGGTVLPSMPVLVDVRYRHDSVEALIVPVEQ